MSSSSSLLMPHHRRSQSQASHNTNSPSHTPTASTTGASPKRKPLHERSRSQANVSPTRGLQYNPEKIYRETPFPKLASQLFPPVSGSRISEDDAFGIPPLPLKSPRRSIASASSVSRDSTGNLDEERVPDIPALWTSSSPHGRDGRQTRKNSKGKGKARDVAPAPVDPLGLMFPSSTTTTTNIPRKPLPSPKTRRPIVPQYPPESSHPRQRPFETSSSDAPRSPLPQKTANRIISQSTVASQSPDIAQSEISDYYYSSTGRPRSASTPDKSAEAWIQELISSGTKVQYPTIRQPSIASLRTEAAARAPYPPPLRLHRKRGTSQLSKPTSSAAQPSATHLQSYSNSRKPHLRHEPSQASGFSSSSLDSYGEVIPGAPIFNPERMSSNWADEMGDVVPELSTPRLGRQRSDLHIHSSSTDSRPPTRDSSSRPGSFYNFLNDSVTAWAHYYYRNESKARLGTPPSVTHLTSSSSSPPLEPSPNFISPPKFNPASHYHPTPNYHPPPSAYSHTAESSVIAESIGRSESPSFADFPETLYVRRLRPREQHTLLNHSRSFSTNGTSVVRHERNDSGINSLAPFTPPHNPTPPLPLVPHLSPDRRAGTRIPYWHAPSIDGTAPSPFSPVNRQIVLFCIGFLFPPAWWLAAFLALPQRPQWARTHPDAQFQEKPLTPETRGRMLRTGEPQMMTSVDLFDSDDVLRFQKGRWWRNLNRAMSLLGICIVAAVIAVAVVASH